MLKSVSGNYSFSGILPPHAYFDPQWHNIADRLIYSRVPKYLGHESLVPENGSYALAPHSDGKLLLLRDKKGVVRCFKNRCCHQGARLIDPTVTPEYSSPEEFGPVVTLKRDKAEGKKSCLVCPLHQWTYEMDGVLRGAPEFEMERIPGDYKKLKEVPIIVYQGAIWTNIDRQGLPWVEELGRLFDPKYFDLQDHFFAGRETTSYECSHLIFSNIYLDDRHVKNGHRDNFGPTMDLGKLNLILGKNFSIQTVGLVMKPERPLCPEYAAWHKWLLRLQKGNPPPYGAVWALIYPNIMIEWYPWSITVSIMVPDGPDRCRNNVEYFYSKELIRMVERGELTQEDVDSFIRADQARYRHTAAEDVDFVLRVARGLRDAYEAGDDFRGLPHPVEEFGMFDYHEYFHGVELEYYRAKQRDLERARR